MSYSFTKPITGTEKMQFTSKNYGKSLAPMRFRHGSNTQIISVPSVNVGRWLRANSMICEQMVPYLGGGGRKNIRSGF
jgi:hypothetical protein